MRGLVHAIMYLSAFLPMLIVMWLREVITLSIKTHEKWQVTNYIEWKYFFNWFLIIEFCIILIILLGFCLLLHGNKNRSTKMVKISKAKNQAANYYLNYFALFVLSLISFSLVRLVDVVTLCLLLFILGVVYTKNGMYYINPTVNILMGFIYEIEYTENNNLNTTVIISKEKISKDDTLLVYLTEYDYTIVKEKVRA